MNRIAMSLIGMAAIVAGATCSAQGSAGHSEYDQFRILSKLDVVGRHCFEGAYEVLQLRSPKLWINDEDVLLSYKTPIVPMMQGEDRPTVCTRKEVFSPGDKLNFRREGETYYLSVERANGTHPLQARRAFPRPSDTMPVYWEIPDTTSEPQLKRDFYLFMAEQMNSVGERTKFYYVVAFDGDCQDSRPPGSVVVLGIDQQCPSDPPGHEKETDVGGGGEGK